MQSVNEITYIYPRRQPSRSLSLVANPSWTQPELAEGAVDLRHYRARYFLHRQSYSPSPRSLTWSEGRCHAHVYQRLWRCSLLRSSYRRLQGCGNFVHIVFSSHRHHHIRGTSRCFCAVSLHFEYKPSMGLMPIHEIAEGHNERIKQFYWKLWYGDNEVLPNIDISLWAQRLLSRRALWSRSALSSGTRVRVSRPYGTRMPRPPWTLLSLQAGR